MTPMLPDAPAERLARITQARSALLHEGLAPAAASIEPWIVRSWQRCLALGHEPGQPVVFDAVGAATLRQITDNNHALLQAARPVLAQLTRAIAGMRYFAMLTDARGVVVEVQGAVDRHDRRARSIGRIGIDLSEAAVGTTAIGAALSELAPVWLHRGEHFFAANGAYSCAGAPLLDPQGRCVGMLDLTGVDVPERPELRHLVSRSARAMEDALVQQLPAALLLRLNWPGCGLGGEGDGLLAIDADGVVLGGNTLARQLLPMPLAPARSSTGTALHSSDLFAMPWQVLFDAAHHPTGIPLEIPLWSGLRLQGLPVSQRQGIRPAPPALPHPVRVSHTTEAAAAPLRETETALILQAVQEARGNVAEAARRLGISRATVYRKIAAPRRRSTTDP